MEQINSQLQNASLRSSDSGNDTRSRLKGVIDPRYSEQVVHYRGIQYAKVAKRFAKPVVTEDWAGSTDCTRFGPRCPQKRIDIRDIMQVPKNIVTPEEDLEPEEDELRCCNLTITCPAKSDSFSLSEKKLPVLIWIHGGGMCITWGNSQQRLGDGGPLVAQSIEMGKPIILVSINHRLNIFGFGSGEAGGPGENVNLAHEDTKAAVQWVKQNIFIFGGDPQNVIVGGESAGSIYTHALLASGAKFERAIMSSGSMYTLPVHPDKRGFGLVGLIEGNLQLNEFDKGNTSGNFGPEATLIGASVESLVKCVEDLGISSMWFWDEPYFKDWTNHKRVFRDLKSLMIGDCEAENFVWISDNMQLSAKQIVQSFKTIEPSSAGEKLMKAYGITDDDDVVLLRKAALEFSGDSHFPAWNAVVVEALKGGTGPKVYQYYYDQANPFAPHSGAHHGADLFACFGAYDECMNEENRKLNKIFRTKWIDFINGEDPWSTDKIFGYGPDGTAGELAAEGEQGVAGRRRHEQCKVIAEVGLEACVQVLQKLKASAGTGVEG